MNEALAKKFFGETPEGCCVKCKLPLTGFRDEISVKAFNMTGWCQFCQDIFYRDPADLQNLPEKMSTAVRPEDSRLSASGEIYTHVKDKNGKYDWYYGSHAGEIYVDKHDPRSRGHAGRKLQFKTKDGIITTSPGPWQTHADSLYVHTGVDMRKKNLTWGIIAHAREAIECDLNFGEYNYRNVVWVDEHYVEGSFDRIEQIARRISEDIGKVLYYSKYSSGGACHGFTNIALRRQHD